MTIIGNIIKGFIGIKDALASDTNPIEEQKAVLQQLLEKAKETDFGVHYGFREILESEDMLHSFAERVPYFDYDRIQKEWWRKLHQHKENVTWPGNPTYFALSSGTTGKESKRIPVTDEMIDAIRKAGIKQVYALSNFDLPPDFFEKEILMLGSSTDLIERNDHLEGEISGISASNIPFWFRGYYKPGQEISKVEDWDERVQKIAENAPKWDIGAISGIPSWIELMLQKVIAYHNLKNIHEIWPNLQVYTSGGVAFDPYEKSFNALMGKQITIIDTYLASEGFIAFQARPETSAMQLITDNGIYFEFVPFHPDYINTDGSLTSNAPVLTLSEVDRGKEYVLLISTVSGAWRYVIGDTIEFTDTARAEIKITGRTKFFLNTVGSQLSVNKMDDAIKHLESAFAIKIPEYTLCAKRIAGEFYHCWYLGTGDDASGQELAEVLDTYLQEANKNYRVARSKALEGVKVSVVQPAVFYDWNARNKKKGGQVKMERVMGEKKFKEWESFVQESITT
ncbi:GH3 auxin-responsive promoter family protein [Flavobacteriaceae bacterium KMM 6897]|nr:GH3 auxin-responsive promoter family protein [Flavobacteriaceae bacterium KMM 6897]